MSNITIGCLLWLNDANVARRLDIVKESLTSLSKITCQNQPVFVTNNGNLDPPFELPQGCVYKKLDNNYFDLTAHYVPYWRALDERHDYFIYLYDDFIIYDSTFIDDAIRFMDENSHVCCMRLPLYKTGDPFFDTNYTPKSKNPDAVRHETGAGKFKLKNDGKTKVGEHEFVFSNWRPSSRPMLWRTSAFAKFALPNVNNHPIMQSFERHMYSVADKLASENNWSSSYIEGGVCHTFPANTSERTRHNIEHTTINMQNFFASYEKIR
jgi:hypothetical protein